MQLVVQQRRKPYTYRYFRRHSGGEGVQVSSATIRINAPIGRIVDLDRLSPLQILHDRRHFLVTKDYRGGPIKPTTHTLNSPWGQASLNAEQDIEISYHRRGSEGQ